MIKTFLSAASIVALLPTCLPSFAQTRTPGLGATFGTMLSKVAPGANAKPTDDAIRSALQATVNQVNKSMPMTVDAITRVDNITVSPTSAKFTYNATLDLPLKDIQAENLLARTKPTLLKGVCTSPDMKIFLDRGVTVGYSYRAKDGAFAGKIEISPADCR